MGVGVRGLGWATAALVSGFTLWAPTAGAVVFEVNPGDGYVEYLGVTGFGVRNAPYRMLVPDDWNGQLLVYARGTGTIVKTNEAGVPQFDPYGFPLLGVTPLTNVPGSPLGHYEAEDILVAALLARHYALVASDYQLDPRFALYGLLGWEVEDGYHDVADVTQEAQTLLGAFLDRIVVWGRSQGSLVALKSFEDQTKPYDGAITGCTVGAGSPRTWDTGMGVAIAFNAAFKAEGGWPSSWGSVAGGDLPLYLSFQGDVAPTLVALLSNPQNFGRFEFIRLVNGLPFQGFYPPPYPLAGTPEFSWLFADMLFLTEVRADLEGPAKANGRVSQNQGHIYQLTQPQMKYLRALGVDAAALLAEMNGQPKIDANVTARQYVEDYANPSGDFPGPVISMHTTVDGLVIPAHESALRETVEAVGKEGNLVQVFTDAVGHCAFTPDQWLATVDAMQQWLDTGNKPGNKAFPTSLGFDHGFMPPPWPQP